MRALSGLVQRTICVACVEIARSLIAILGFAFIFSSARNVVRIKTSICEHVKCARVILTHRPTAPIQNELYIIANV